MNTLKLCDFITERYQRYLETTFYLKDPILRKSFRDCLTSGYLKKGPYLEATKTFSQGKKTGELFKELIIKPIDKGFLNALLSERPLYFHQEEAINRVFRDDENVVVATGTASGKTETFLFPILLHLYREFLSSELASGVRALILYPMNALVYDQKERLGNICERLKIVGSPFRFTFGQYTGETPDNENDTRRQARLYIKNRFEGELVLRKEIRENPPHILLTNYSMLEYLLIRPDDSPLFSNGSAKGWKFIVLDEAHQYSGAKGVEMAMLIRRLKRRLREGGRSEPLRCIATSATIAEGEEDRLAVSKFASDLFGEKFNESSVILGKTESVADTNDNFLNWDDYKKIKDAISLNSGSDLSEMAARLGIKISNNLDVKQTIGLILKNDCRANKLRQLIMNEPKEIRVFASEIFPEIPREEQEVALSELINLLVSSEDPSSKVSLLSARYHIFLRSLEGAFIAFYPQKRIITERRSKFDKGAVFEIALCRECGQHYLVGRYQGGQLKEAIRDPGNLNFGATFFLPIEDAIDLINLEESEESSRKIYELCIECGAMVLTNQKDNKLKCSHINSIFVEEQEEAKEKEDQIPKCIACGYRAPDPVREVIHGTDGPHAVISTALYQGLSPDRRKILAFTDGRQDAAFFAWYLENSYKSILNRNYILKSARKLGEHAQEGLSLRDLASCLKGIFKERKAYPPATTDLELHLEAWKSIYQEFLTDQPRISLEGVGSLRWLVKFPDDYQMPNILFSPPWSFNKKDAQELIFVLLDYMRSDRAVELQPSENIYLNWDDLELQASQQCVRIGLPRSERNVRSWEGIMGKRSKFLSKILIGKGLKKPAANEIAVETLKAIWESFAKSDESKMDKIRFLRLTNRGCRLNPDWWRANPISQQDNIFLCDTCSRIQSVYVNGFCTRYGCTGKVKKILASMLESNHYRSLYEDSLPGVLRSEEHTAQINKEQAREFQRAFKSGDIHVLSCSTTFELGVDLGDLDNIFLRNVPPEVFNYAQRVGRAGRRKGFPGLAITYCRRSPHDLYHFANPNERILKGQIQPPGISICNEKIIERHIVATTLSLFFKQNEDRFRNVHKFIENFENPMLIKDFHEFLLINRYEIIECLKEIIPSELVSRLELDSDGWIARVVGENSRLYISQIELSHDFMSIQRLEKLSAEKKDYRTADWANRRAETIASEDVLSFLSRKAIIPKYGFPVDVVELDTHRINKPGESSEVMLQRDLSIAIVEFAPTAKLVANKKEWTSYGVKRVPEREWDHRFYRRCPTHNFFITWKKAEKAPLENCCTRAMNGQYIVPIFGFITNRERPKQPKARPPRVFSTRPYFIGLSEANPDVLKRKEVDITKSSSGRMAVLCEGRRGNGFYICSICGAGFRERENKHKSPYGAVCTGTLSQVALGHEFETDVIQLRFKLGHPDNDISNVWFAYSLAYALVEGAAKALDVSSDDLNTTVAYMSEVNIPPIILYDDVPGGAGLVSRLGNLEVFYSCLEFAYERVSGSCGCGEDDSCYGCIRSYRNQFAHQNLKRGPVMNYLEKLIAGLK